MTMTDHPAQMMRVITKTTLAKLGVPPIKSITIITNKLIDSGRPLYSQMMATKQHSNAC